ncbi:hypothetical protein LTR95_005183 [Oleoguttula sp. CCFEE 5521]
MESRRKPLVAITSVLLFTLLIGYFAVPSLYITQDYAVKSHKPSFTAPKQNIWAELDEVEAQDVYEFLLEDFKHLNLTRHPKSLRDNFVNTVESLKPNKTDAVAYLYGDAEVVDRYAKVSISQYTDGAPYFFYYTVGPLPVTKETKAEPYGYPFNHGRNWIRSPIVDFFHIQQFSVNVAKNVSDITQALLGATVNENDPNDPRGLVAFPRSFRVVTGGLNFWLQMYRPSYSSGARTLLPQGLYVKIDAKSLDFEEWTVGQYYYNGVIYDDEHKLRAAINSPGFEKTPANLDGPWTDTEDFESTPAGRELPPPAVIQPYGPRYQLDRKQKYISWFGFEFFLTTNAAQGVLLYDIRFKGERVMYEVGLQEAMAHYAGDDPMQGGLEWMDSFFGMGKDAFELLPGYDCPAYADYLDSQTHDKYETTTIPNNICVFEYTSDFLLARHSAQYSTTASRNTYLTVRSVSTVGNYDYTIDYVFYLDGTLEVKVRASGFIFAAFYTTNSSKTEDEYGHRVHTALSTSMHDHVINFKADMDVAGPKNDLVRLAIEPVTKSYSWDGPDVPKRNTMHLVEYNVTEETGLDWPKNGGEFYIVYSDKKNTWGERKGYRITSGTGMGNTPHLTIINSTTLGDSARWAEHDLWVLRQKDSEPRGADPFNFLEPFDPIVKFSQLADGESLIPSEDYDQDLVIYFNVGAHHVPTSVDIPNTLMHTSGTSVMFVPHNFNDRDPSRESSQGVRIQLDGKKLSGGFAGEAYDEDPSNGELRTRHGKRDAKTKKLKAHYFGGTYEKSVKVPLEALEPNFEGYRSTMHAVPDLTFNGSTVFGTWKKED